ncbi:MAG: hypothetical protein F6K10_11220 [Moorea sp. SIO2B7]|nr:hypothetical protein [Moorena sp. SIO2B7]
MSLTQVDKFLTNLITNKSRSWMIFLFTLSLTFAALYGFLGIQQGFSSQYVVQDDARQHLFWMQRFIDPDLFPNDLIADFYQSLAPGGYKTLYQLMSLVGVPPLVFSKFVPTILGVITAGYCFGVCLEIISVPMAAFISSMLLSQNLWMQDTLISGTASSFLHPLLVAFLYYFIRKELLPMGIVIILFGLFYPTYVLICCGLLVLQLLRWDKGSIGFSKSKQDYIFSGVGLGIAFFVLLPYALQASEFGPIITAGEARKLPEFQPGARASFFHDHDPWRFWFNANRTGIRVTSALMPPLVYGGLLLPFLLGFSQYFPLVKEVSNKVVVLLQLTGSSLTVFFIAHALIFRLFLPSRYTQHSLRIVLVLAAGIAVTLLLDAILNWAKTISMGQVLGIGLTICIVSVLIFYPFSLNKFPWTGYRVGTKSELYRFFSAQPKDILISSLDDEISNIPTFSGRSILVGSEYALPYHVGYYSKIRQRITDLIWAQYSYDREEIKDFVEKYGIDFWLLHKSAFEPEYLANNRWLSQYQPATKEAITSLKKETFPILANLINSCSVFESNDLVVIDTECI